MLLKFPYLYWADKKIVSAGDGDAGSPINDYTFVLTRKHNKGMIKEIDYFMLCSLFDYLMIKGSLSEMDTNTYGES
jgi:hypothetical protein